MKATSWGHDDFYPEFRADLMRAYRIDEGLSQAELGRRIGCERAMVCNWERGHSTPVLRHLDALAAALGVSRAALLDDADEVVDA